MMTVLSRATDEQARKELKPFTLVGFACAIIGLFVAAWIGVVGVGFGGRGLLVSFHKGNARRKGLTAYRVLAALSLLVGLFDIVAATLS